MISLYSVQKYYDVELNNCSYNIIVDSTGEVIDQVEVFKDGDNITETNEAKEVLDYFYDNLESE